jgi:aspartate/methionine/tyrosine aminotransferase
VTRRLQGIPGFSIDRVAAAAGADPDVLRLENLDTDLAPPKVAVDATMAAVMDTRAGRDRDEANSYLPFTGSRDLRVAIGAYISRVGGATYDPDTEIVVTCGGTEGILDALMALTDPGDEVVLSDPTYAGMIQRVRLVGAVPRLVPYRVREGMWRFDVDALRAAIGDRTRVLFLMSPSMPSGAMFDDDEWDAIVSIVRTNPSITLLYNAAMERLVYDGRSIAHPATMDGMRDRTVIIGSISKAQRMIGWRIGWVAGPASMIADVARAHIYNVVTPTGIAQAGAAAALRENPDDVSIAVAEWQRRRDTVMTQLADLPLVKPAGGWSLLVDVGALGLDARTASERMLAHGKVAATPMTHWGEVNGDRFVRLVFSNEPVERLATLGARLRGVLR